MASFLNDDALPKWLTFTGPALEVAPEVTEYTWGSFNAAPAVTLQGVNVVIPSFVYNFNQINVTGGSNSILTTELGVELTTENGLLLTTETPTYPISTNPIPPYIVLQFNYTVSQPFTILNWPIQAFNNQGFWVCIRYRLGNRVVRYLLNNQVTGNLITTEGGLNLTTEDGLLLSIETPDFIQHFNGKPYTGQLILQNFVLEFWRLYGIPNAFTLTLTNPVIINTSMQYVPASTSDGAIVLPSAATYPYTVTTLPANLPISFDPLNAWIDNSFNT